MPQILQKLGDAIAGVDAEGAYLGGLGAKTDIEYTRSQTDAAIELARQRRAEAEAQQMQNQAFERVRQMDAATMAGPGIGDIVAGDFGSSYAGATQGLLRNQEQGFRGTIGDPEADQAARVAAAQAVSPSRLSGEGLGDQIAYQVVQGDDGQPVLVPNEQAAGRVAMNRLNPAANRSGTGSGDGLFESADTNAIRGAVADFYGGVFDPTTGRISGLNPAQGQQSLQVVALASQLFAQGRAPDHGTAVAMAVTQLFPDMAAQFDERLFQQQPLGDAIAGPGRSAPSSGLEVDAGAGGDDWQEGDVVVNPTTGERLQLRGGQWVPIE